MWPYHSSSSSFRSSSANRSWSTRCCSIICEKPSQVLGVFGPQTALVHRRLQRLVGLGAGGEQNPSRASWLMQQVVLVQDYNVAHEIPVAERAEKGLDPVMVVVRRLWYLLENVVRRPAW